MPKIQKLSQILELVLYWQNQVKFTGKAYAMSEMRYWQFCYWWTENVG